MGGSVGRYVAGLVAVCSVIVLLPLGRPSSAAETIPSEGRNLWCNVSVSAWAGDRGYGSIRYSWSDNDRGDMQAITARWRCHYDPEDVTLTPSALYQPCSPGNQPTAFWLPVTDPGFENTGWPIGGDGCATLNGYSRGQAWGQTTWTGLPSSWPTDGDGPELDDDFAVAGGWKLLRGQLAFTSPGSPPWWIRSGISCGVGQSPGCPAEVGDEVFGYVQLETHAFPADAGETLPPPAWPPPPTTWAGAEPPLWPGGGDIEAPQVGCQQEWSDTGGLGSFALSSHVSNPVPGAHDAVTWKVREASGREVYQASGRDAVFSPERGGVGTEWVATVSVRRTVELGGFSIPPEAVELRTVPHDDSVWTWFGMEGAPSWLDDFTGDDTVDFQHPDGTPATVDEIKAYLSGVVYEVGASGETPGLATAVAVQCSRRLVPGAPESGDVVTPPGVDPEGPGPGGEDPPDWWDDAGDGGGGGDPGDGPGEDCAVGGSVPLIGDFLEGLTGIACALWGALGDLLDAFFRLLGELLRTLFVPDDFGRHWESLRDEVAEVGPIGEVGGVLADMAGFLGSPSDCDEALLDLSDPDVPVSADAVIPCEPPPGGAVQLGRTVQAAAMWMGLAGILLRRVYAAFGAGQGSDVD